MLDHTRTVADLVAEHRECGPVLHRHRIDFCCHGDRTLEVACVEGGVDLGRLCRALEDAIEERERGAREDLRALSSEALVAHIVDTHHAFLREALPFVESLAAKVERVHGEADPSMVELAGLVAQLRLALELHLDREEEVLFPALLGGSREAAEELRTMLDEHHVVGALLARMSELTAGYRAPEGACGSWRTLLAELAALEADIVTHVHLENRVLAPRFSRASP